MHNFPSPLESLETLHFSAGMPAATLRSLAKLGSVRTLVAGEIIFREGEHVCDLFLVHSGCVALDMHVPGRGTVRLLTVGAGEILGWSAILGDCVMTATATTLEPTTSVVIPGAELQQLCDGNHEIGYEFMRRLAVALSRRLVATRLQLLDLFAETTPHVLGQAAGS